MFNFQLLAEVLEILMIILKLRKHALWFQLLTRNSLRETNQCLKSSSIINKWWWPDSPQPSSNLSNAKTPLWLAKCIFPFKSTFTLSSSTCFLHALFSLPFLLWASTSISNVLLKTWPFSLLNTWPYQQTLFVIDNWSIVSFKPNINSIALFPSSSWTPHITLTKGLFILPKIPISLSFRHHASLSYRIAVLT